MSALRPKQVLAAKILGYGFERQVAADYVNVALSTIRNWRKKPEFRALEAEHREAFQQMSLPMAVLHRQMMNPDPRIAQAAAIALAKLAASIPGALLENPEQRGFVNINPLAVPPSDADEVADDRPTMTSIPGPGGTWIEVPLDEAPARGQPAALPPNRASAPAAEPATDEPTF
jgi:hypothetical protein